MSPAGLNVLKLTGCTGKFKCPLKKTQPSYPGSRNLYWTGKGLREEHRLRVFETRVLRRIFGVKRDEATEEWRKLYNEELNNLNCLTNIVWVIKSRRMRSAGHVARMGIREVCLEFWWSGLRGKDH
jgi:hypothetical protein